MRVSAGINRVAHPIAGPFSNGPYGRWRGSNVQPSPRWWRYVTLCDRGVLSEGGNILFTVAKP
jgi:hypothetical protein